ncbi:DUF1345 domain-containing protein [Mesorhizobium sp. PUT5]|uniref:DUF1345 domain-containing protein n=1 Tax=Mesorhizobium sp. PUT5 TaxID=3454629 RepID=UPI003FA47DA4
MNTASAKPLARRHTQFLLSAGIGIAALVVSLFLHARLSYLIGANAFFLAYDVLILLLMRKLSASYLSRNARAADQPVFVIFAVTLLVVGAAVVSMFQLINDKQHLDPWSLAFALAVIPLGWFTIHSMAALHYAHVYWMDDPVSASKKKLPVGGFGFPNTEKPQGWDFLYFSAVIGMTAQTSDTSVTTTEMRRVVLVHSIVAFFFNTVIVAAAVNVAVNLAG